MNAVEIHELDFAYKKKAPILNKVNMIVPQGCIYGFLGANGAGKTTTLKLILNLLKNKSKGTIKVLGQDIGIHYPSYLSQIGSLIENASLYSHLTAKENLKLWCNYFDIAPVRVDEVLEIIGLQNSSMKNVRDFSTGMKQRLGLGISIMHNPEIYILDEPTNGLDPLGINNLRHFLQNLRNEGKTILISSHILSEIEKLVDYIGIIKNGSILFEGTIERLNELAMSNTKVIVKVDEIKRSESILKEHFTTTIQGNHLHISTSSKDDINRIVRLIIDHDIRLHEVRQPKKTLETIFMNLVKES